MKILYIYGYGGSSKGSTGTTLKKLLPNDDVRCVDYPQGDCAEAYSFFVEYIEREKIDVVVASSLGAFIAMTLRGVRKIVINPCMRPSKALPHIGVPNKKVATYKDFEHKALYPPCRERRRTIGIFSTEDELLGDFFVSHFRVFGGRVRRTNLCNHRANEEMLRHDVVPIIDSWR